MDLTGLQVDHINGDGLDCRRSNLRVATPSQNQCNQTRKALGKSSRYKGVAWHKTARQWAAHITVDGQHINLGQYDDERDAADAYADAALEYHGAFAAPRVELAAEVATPTPVAPRQTPRKACGTSSRFLRTTLHRRSGKWAAQVRNNEGRLEHVPGLSDDPEEMALLADILARHIRGDVARHNFPGILATLPGLYQISDEQIGIAVEQARRAVLES